MLGEPVTHTRFGSGKVTAFAPPRMEVTFDDGTVKAFSYPQAVERFIRFVDENYMHKLRLSDFAAAEGYSMSYLSHFIKEAMNQTFQEYVLSVRLNCACRLMAAGGKRMLDICMESGFSDYRYFSRAFQKQFAMTPEAYSRSRREEESLPGAHRSIHSVERFYTREDSLRLLSQLETEPPRPPQ